MALPKAIFLSAAFVLLGTSCAPMHRHHGDHDHPGMMPMLCTPGNCRSKVTVIDCAAGRLAVTPDPIPVDEPVNMQWTIVTPGYRFDTARGIEVSGPGFTSHGASGNLFTVHNGHERSGYFKYAVNVIRESDSTVCAVYDPYINNR